MRKVLMLFLFISFSSFSQSISFDDIKIINSKESYDRFVIENNFSDDKSHILSDGYGHRLITKKENRPDRFGEKSLTKEYIDVLHEHPEYEDGSKRFYMIFNFFVNDIEQGAYGVNTGQDTTYYFTTNNRLYPTDDYKFILNEVKNQCNFYKIMTESGRRSVNDGPWIDFSESYSCYSCPGSKYPGKICFRKGVIRINDMEDRVYK